MDKGKLALACAAAVSACVAAASLARLADVGRRIREFEAAHGGDVLANLDKAQLDEKAKKEIAREAEKKRESGNATSSSGKGGDGEPKPAAPEKPSMAVIGTTYDGDGLLRVWLSQRPDMDVAREYITVGPMKAGAAAIEYDAPGGRPMIRIAGDFAHRTNVILRIRKGFPLCGKNAAGNSEGALKEDFEYVFRRNDRKPYVKFTDSGRYLPPGGDRTIGIESVNVGRICTKIRRLEPRNIVQFLARENEVYNSQDYFCTARGCDAHELSGEAETGEIKCENKVNEKENSALRIHMGDGKPENGVFAVQINDKDRSAQPCDYYGNCDNSTRYKLVCLSDLGLSVREAGNGALAVWVASLMNGRPVSGAKIEVFSAANIKIMEGRTGPDGLCRPLRIGKGEPFAVVARTESGDDMTFMALRDSAQVDETYPDGAREPYLGGEDVNAFVWTDRGIYRHGETIRLHVLVRNGSRRAPRPVPVEIRLLNPDKRVFSCVTKTTDADGSILHDGFSVPSDQPSGHWCVQVKLPGNDGKVLGGRDVKIEEFAPPQIRVAVKPDVSCGPGRFAFTVSAEHLFGGPAQGLRCEGAVVFEDAPFTPATWKGWRFGNGDLGFKPCFRRLGDGVLDKDGKCALAAPLWADAGLPKAMVRATAQGVVFEDGGRPATARAAETMHFYPYYIGSTMPDTVDVASGTRPTAEIACVAPDGTRLGTAKRLRGKIQRIDTVYSCRTLPSGWQTWDCERIRATVAEDVCIEVPADGNATVELPVEKPGDYVFSVSDPESNVSFSLGFYLGGGGDDAVRARLSNPTEVTLVPDKACYRPGDTPKLLVKSPFAGAALLSVMREKEMYSEVLALSNATCEVALRPVSPADAPNLDVYISVLQGAVENARHLAFRAHGQATVAVRPEEEEIPVTLDVSVPDCRRVEVEVAAPGASAAIVTLVDEAINILTGEETPDPAGAFLKLCGGWHPLYDIYGAILPVMGGGPRASGVKTGGGFGAEMLERVSPVPTRRFKPLALWSGLVPVSGGRARATFEIPEFAGEVRATAVAFSPSAAGAASVRRKVSPKLVMQPDAPRFAAPGDIFEISLPVHNRSGADATFGFEISADGAAVTNAESVALAKDGSLKIAAMVPAPGAPGEMRLVFRVRGAGEEHESEILLPIRPAVAWSETAGVVPESEWRAPESGIWSAKTFDSPLAGLSRSLEWLADYPHGCLEQTTSRMFPLICAGGILNSVATNGSECVKAGVRRVESMVRSNDFVMWPDCNYAPWDREVSLYAAHFLVEAEKSGFPANDAARSRVLGMLKKWAMSTNTAVSAYACHTLALAGRPEKDRMLRLYDIAPDISLLSRARLARAFAMSHDRPRAERLLANAAAPSSVKEAAFAAIALAELDPDDARIPPLIEYLDAKRDRAKLSWGTTEENAHALLAMGEWFRRRPPRKGEKFVSWRKLELPDVRDVKNVADGISVSRRFFGPDGEDAGLSPLRCGQMLIAEISLKVEDSRDLSDLVVEDLFAGAFEPVHGMPPAFIPPEVDTNALKAAEWVMRSDARDDRMLVFSKKFRLEKGREARFRYPVRVVSAGDFILPGPSVEGMYHPALRSSRVPGRIVVRH